MSIRFISPSHESHITSSTITVTTQYLMDSNDFYRGFGELIDCDGNILNSDFPLPGIGQKYNQYYFLEEQTGTMWDDVVLNDITESRNNARDGNLPFDTSGWNKDTMTLVTFLWTNNGEKDAVTPGDPSSTKFEVETNTNIITTNSYKKDGDELPIIFADLYFKSFNPEIFIDTVDDEGDPITKSLGNYVGNTLVNQKWHIDHNDSPPHEVYDTQSILKVTLYSKNNFAYLYNDNLKKINSVDFLTVAYNRREQRLLDKNRVPTFEASDITSVDDTFRWLFFDYSKTEHSIDIYKYELFFIYKADTWKKWYGSDVDEYINPINFNNVLIEPTYNV